MGRQIDLLPEAKQRDIAMERVMGLFSRFGQAHLDLASHAAVPIVLTPELLYQLWARFVPHAPYVAVADVLLSAVVHEVGFEAFEMDAPVRNLLLEELTDIFGKPRAIEVAQFLRQYVRPDQQSHDPDAQDLAYAQRSAAMLWINPSAGVAELIAEAQASAAKGNTPDGRSEVQRLVGLVRVLGGQLDAEQRERLQKVLPKPPRSPKPSPRKAVRYVNFDVRFTEHRFLENGEEHVRAEVSIDGAGGGGFTVRVPPEIRTLARAILRGSLNGEEISRFGEALCSVLFGLGSRRLFADLYARLQPHERIRIRIAAVPPLASLPWEFVAWRSNDDMRNQANVQSVADSVQSVANSLSGFLALDPRISIVRVSLENNLPVALPELNANEPVQVMALLASPHAPELAQIDLAHEQQSLQQILNNTSAFHLNIVSQAVPEQFFNAALPAEAPPAIVYVRSPGYFELEEAKQDAALRGTGVLALASSRESAERIPANDLAERFVNHSVRLIILNVRQSARRDDVSETSSLCSALALNTPAVIGLQGTLDNDSSTLFGEQLLGSLASGQSVDLAVNTTRRTLSEFGRLEWGHVVMYLNASTTLLFAKENPQSDEVKTTGAVAGSGTVSEPDQSAKDDAVLARLSQLQMPTEAYLLQLCEGIEARFNRDELDAFLFDLGMKSQDQITLSAQVIVLVNYFAKRREDLPSLIYALQQLRPNADWVNAPKPAKTLDRTNQRAIMDAIVRNFDFTELRVLCVDLEVEYENLRGETTPQLARELVQVIERRDEIAKLISMLREMRPNYDWSMLSESKVITDQLQPSSSSSTPSAEPAISEIGRLRERISESFSIEELRELIFDLGLNPDNFRNDTKDIMIRELLSQVTQQGSTRELIEHLQVQRPSINWQNLSVSNPPMPTPSKQTLPTAIALRNFLAEKFDAIEIDVLCADLSIILGQNNIKGEMHRDFIGGGTRLSVALNLIQYCERRGWYAYLVQAVRQARPDTEI